jgi:transposase
MKPAFGVAAGIDVHRDSLVVSVRSKGMGSDDDIVTTKSFETFRDTLVEMCEWLAAERVEVVALESTGVYWMPVVRVLQEKLLRTTVWLVNPLDVKRRAGRKTDRKDSQWLSEVALYALVPPSFLPSREQSELRKLTRHRTKLVADQTRYQNRILKELESSGVKLASVLSDCLGMSGRAMIDALLENKPGVDVADLALGTLRKKIPTIRRAVEGSFTPSTAMVLRQLLAMFDETEKHIQAVDQEISRLMQPWSAEDKLVQTMPAIAQTASPRILAELGVDMSAFPGAKNIAAWAGLAPGSEESAGKAKAAPTREGNKYLRTILVQCAWVAVRMKQGFWPQVFRRLRSRLGPKKAIVAVARKMLVALYYILRDRTPYREPSLDLPVSPQHRDRLARRLQSKLEDLGYNVQISKTAQQGSVS